MSTVHGDISSVEMASGQSAGGDFVPLFASFFPQNVHPRPQLVHRKASPEKWRSVSKLLRCRDAILESLDFLRNLNAFCPFFLPLPKEEVARTVLPEFLVRLLHLIS